MYLKPALPFEKGAVELSWLPGGDWHLMAETEYSIVSTWMKYIIDHS
jgi:hypothetical protein